MNEKRLIEILEVQTSSYRQWRMFAYIIRQLKEIEADFFVEDGCIYVTKGEAVTYPCIVAHMDTVHKITDSLSVLKVGHKLTGFDTVNMKQAGIGGDDKVGIFIALECLRKFDNIKAVFFRDEEVGCEGSGMANMAFFDDCRYVLQCDRKGNSDFITSASGVQLSDKPFKKAVKQYLKKYGYKQEHGMMTDVMVLKENGLDVCAANISCGYYHPHSSYEYVNTIDVDVCLSLVMDIINNLGEERYEHKYTPVKSKYVYDYKEWKSGVIDSSNKDSGRLARSSFFDDYTPVHKTKLEYCDCCSEAVKSTKYVAEFNCELCDVCIKDFTSEPEKYES